MKNTPVLIPVEEKRELQALAARAGVSLGFAMRVGARHFLEARLSEPPRRGRPRKEAKAA